MFPEGQLAICGTRLVVDRFVKPVYVPHIVDGLVSGVGAEMSDLADSERLSSPGMRGRRRGRTAIN